MYCVGFSQAEAAAAMTRHLLARGRRRIAFGAAQLDPRTLQRLQGWRQQAARRLHDAALEWLNPAPSSMALGAQMFEQIVGQSPRVDAVFFCNDDLAQGALLAATRLGVAVPQRVAVAGFNDLTGSDQMMPPLTTVRTPRARSARRRRDAAGADARRGGPAAASTWATAGAAAAAPDRLARSKIEGAHMQLGMIGAGRMGANMVRRLLRGGHRCVVHSRSPAELQPLVADGARAAASLPDLVAQLSPPRAVWLMVPAAAVDATIDALAPLLGRGDIVIDGGNSHFVDDLQRSSRSRPAASTISTSAPAAACGASSAGTA